MRNTPRLDLTLSALVIGFKKKTDAGAVQCSVLKSMAGNGRMVLEFILQCGRNCDPPNNMPTLPRSGDCEGENALVLFYQDLRVSRWIKAMLANPLLVALFAALLAPVIGIGVFVMLSAS